MAKDANNSQHAVIDIINDIEGSFKHLESYTEVPPTAVMTNAMVKITTKLLSILAITTKEIKQDRSSELVDMHKLPSTYFR